MAAQSESYDVAVVGGGAIGLACAREAARRGARAVVFDAGEPGAWHVAAGMLAPVSEADFGERSLLELGLESARLYPGFVAALEDPGYRAVGTLVVARDRDEAEALAWGHASGDTMNPRTREPAERAERAPAGRRPSNLIRVVPA